MKGAIRLRLVEERGSVCQARGLEKWSDEPIDHEMHGKNADGEYTRDNVILSQLS